MEPFLRTFLPILPWLLQKAGVAATREEERALYLRFVPPPDNIVRAFREEVGPLGWDWQGWQSPFVRRWWRRRLQRLINRRLHHLWPVYRRWIAKLRKQAEAEGCRADPSRMRKLVEKEKETKEEFAQLEESDDLLKAFPFIPPSRKHDVVTLLLEFALTGEAKNRPRIRRTSGVWSALGLNPDQLQGLSDKAAVELIMSWIAELWGIGGKGLDESGLRQMMRWVVRTHLPPEQEPETTPEAIAKAVDLGLVYRGREMVDDEMGEVVEVAVEDPSASRFVLQVEKKEEREEARRALDRLALRAKLSRGERLVLQGWLEGLEGEELAEWVKTQAGGKISQASVPVLASRTKAKLRAAPKD